MHFFIEKLQRGVGLFDKGEKRWQLERRIRVVMIETKFGIQPAHPAQQRSVGVTTITQRDTRHRHRILLRGVAGIRLAVHVGRDLDRTHKGAACGDSNVDPEPEGQDGVEGGVTKGLIVKIFPV